MDIPEEIFDMISPVTIRTFKITRNIHINYNENRREMIGNVDTEIELLLFVTGSVKI